MNYSWDNYVQLQVDAHQDLLDNEEPLQETRKVTLLLQGITDHNLKNSVDVARSNADYRRDFDKCQLFFSQVSEPEPGWKDIEVETCSLQLTRGWSGKQQR